MTDRYLFVNLPVGQIPGLNDTVVLVVDTQPSSGNAVVVAASRSSAAMATYRDALNAAI